MTDLQKRLEAAVGDRYRVDRELGRGGMAIVYLAEDLKHHRRVAVKVLQPEISHALGSERFLREIEIAAQLTHPNILPLHDSGVADGLLYYAMPYLEGESLRGRLDREKQLPLDQALQITREVADALAHAHSRGLVHRDIKPENVLFQSGHAVVSDFGIARAIGKAGGERLTDTGLALGTPIYMSPEQASGEQEIDARTDIYSLGCLLYEMLAGSPPYTGANPQAILARKIAGPVPSLRVVRDTVPVNVEQVIARALAKVPADRFATATEFSTALDRAVTSGPVPVAVPRLFTRRRAGAIAAVVVVLLGGGWWLWRNIISGPSVDSLVVLPFDNLSGDTAQQYFVAGMHDALISELAQIGALRVISRTSALRYKDSGKSLPEIARELNVRGVVEGSVLRSGDSVRIQVRLIQALPTERHLSTQAYRRDLRDVLALHSHVARAIAREIEVALAPEEARRLASARPVNAEAYEAYLKGKFHAYKFSPQDLDIALGYFESALEKDPAYALAYTGIAVVWSGRQQMGFVPPREATPKARAAVLRALELDSTLAEAHFALAGIKGWHDWEWEAAEASFRRVIALNPNYPDPRVFYSLLLNILGRSTEAMAQIERALALDPFNSFFRTMYGADLLFVRRYDEAIAQFRNVLQSDPNHLPALFNLHVAFHQKGMYEQALAQARTIYAAMGDREVEGALARGYAEGGYRVAMRRAAETLAARSRTTYVLPFDVAALYRFAGDHDQALNWLEKAYEARDPNLPFLGSPDWEGLRGHPRFQALVRRLRLPT